MQSKIGVYSDSSEHNIKKVLWTESGINYRLGFNAIAIQGQGLKPFNNNIYKYLDPEGPKLMLESLI